MKSMPPFESRQRFEATGNARKHRMALSLPPGLTPSEEGFLCEMELVTVIPRQRLEGLELLGVSAPLEWQCKAVPSMETA